MASAERDGTTSMTYSAEIGTTDGILAGSDCCYLCARDSTDSFSSTSSKESR